MPNTLVIYHKNCPSGDGFGAAFAAWLALGDSAEYYPADYGDPVPSVSGRAVYILDLSFQADTLAALSQQAASLTLLDHHLTAQRKLATFKPACCGKIHFDLTKCGSMLAWEHFHPGKPAPRLFRWLQARDLWTWDEPHAKEFLTWLDAQERSFARWAQVLAMSEAEIEAAIELGRHLARQYEGLCQVIAEGALPVTIAGEKGLMVNASGAFRSEVGSLLAARSGTFGLVWRVVEEGTVLCSLRSSGPYDVERLALLFGGGGHATAASFKLPVERLASLATGLLVV